MHAARTHHSCTFCPPCRTQVTTAGDPADGLTLTDKRGRQARTLGGPATATLRACGTAVYLIDSVSAGVTGGACRQGMRWSVGCGAVVEWLVAASPAAARRSLHSSLTPAPSPQALLPAPELWDVPRTSEAEAQAIIRGASAQAPALAAGGGEGGTAVEPAPAPAAAEQPGAPAPSPAT